MDELKKQKWIKYYIPCYLYAGIIFALSSYSFAAGPDIPSFGDKYIHIIEYGIFGYLLGRAFFHSNSLFFKRYFILLALLVGGICGIMDEYYQSFVPLRMFEVFDLVADAIGILAGVIIYKIRYNYADKLIA